MFLMEREIAIILSLIKGFFTLLIQYKNYFIGLVFIVAFKNGRTFENDRWNVSILFSSAQ